jgi:DNA (cytosine-5)-methyltransferase 1
MTHLGLFEGIGGFMISARAMNWQTLAWCEWNPFCQNVLKHHFPNSTGHADINTTDFTVYRGQVDVVTGGFPCQPYSSAGKRKGTADARYLWPQMLRAVQEINPRWVVA